MEDWEKEMMERNKKAQLEIKEFNNKILVVPECLNENEKTTYEEILKSLKESIKYKLCDVKIWASQILSC